MGHSLFDIFVKLFLKLLIYIEYYITRDHNKEYLSYDVAYVSEITPCNKIDKQLVVYRFTGNVMTST